MKKSHLNVLASGVMLGVFALSLQGCGGSAGGLSIPGSSAAGNSSAATTSAGSQASSSASDDDSMLTNDLEYGDDGKPLFDNVQLNVWSIIGSPDDVVFKKLIQAFNNEYLGQIQLNVTYVGHFDYYNTLETTWQNDPASAPEVCFMHNEKTTQYAYKGYLYPIMDKFYEKTKVSFDFAQAYDNINRVTLYDGTRYAIPVDAHGFVTQFRQDIIKKNNLGFENNTRFIPNSRAEYQTLLEGLRAKADAGNLYIRNINKGENHTWKLADKTAFFPEFTQSTDPDGLGALYANGGTMASDDHKKITFQNNNGFKTYLTDQVNRWNNKLMGENGTNTEGFGNGNCAIFSEGPWWIAQTYTPNWNNAELRTVSTTLGVSQDDVDNYSYPLTSSHPIGWWTTDEYASSATAKKWYGNGHAISFTKRITSYTKLAAAMTFAKWYTQGKDADKGTYNLATWTTGGHVPAWKNVYNSTEYQTLLASNVTLQSLGNPEDIIAMEDIPYESTVFNGVNSAVAQVQSALKSTAGCTVDQAVQLLNDVASSTQDSLDSLYEAE